MAEDVTIRLLNKHNAESGEYGEKGLPVNSWYLRTESFIVPLVNTINNLTRAGFQVIRVEHHTKNEPDYKTHFAIIWYKKVQG